MNNRKEAITREINLGECVCKKLKDIYFHDKPWAECYREVGYKLSELKRTARNFYTDKMDMEILMELARYSTNDIQDAIEMNWEPCVKRSNDFDTLTGVVNRIDPR